MGMTTIEIIQAMNKEQQPLYCTKKEQNDAVDATVEALEKQIPVTITESINKEDRNLGSIIFKKGTAAYICNCSSLVSYLDRYCRKCGQALDWSNLDK